MKSVGLGETVAKRPKQLRFASKRGWALWLAGEGAAVMAVCPLQGDMPLAPAVSSALVACSNLSASELRLGFHAASASTNPGSARGMAAALQLIQSRASRHAGKITWKRYAEK